MVDLLFNICVMFLVWASDMIGVSYQAINVWIFCIAWPIFTVWLIWAVLTQRKEIKKLQK